MLYLVNRLKTPGQKYLPTHKGFTLIELVIASGIIAVILALVMVNFRDFEKSSILSNDAEKLASVLHQTQIWALTGQLRGGTRPHSYGVHLTSCSSPPCDYVVFADLNKNYTYDDGSDEEITGDDYSLSVNIQVSLQLDSGTVSSIDVAFEPPAAVIYFNGNQLFDIANIQLTHATEGHTKNISLNRISGQIDVQ